jgi:transposase-like protein
MKGKRHTTEQKIRILRESDGGKSIVEVSKAISLASLRHGQIFTNPKLQDGPPSRSVPPLRIANHHRSQHIKPSQRLTLHLAQFSGPAQNG